MSSELNQPVSPAIGRLNERRFWTSRPAGVALLGRVHAKVAVLPNVRVTTRVQDLMASKMLKELPVV